MGQASTGTTNILERRNVRLVPTLTTEGTDARFVILHYIDHLMFSKIINHLLSCTCDFGSTRLPFEIVSCRLQFNFCSGGVSFLFPLPKPNTTLHALFGLVLAR